MHRSTFMRFKRYRNGVLPDWITRPTDGLHVEIKDKSLQGEHLPSSCEGKISSPIPFKEQSIYGQLQPKKIFQEKIEEGQERISLASKRVGEHIHEITNKHSALTKTKHSYIPKIERKTIYSTKELKLQVNSVESKIVKKERRQDTKTILDEKLNKSGAHTNQICLEVNDCFNHCSLHLDEIVTDDDVDEESDLKRWKSRELNRIKRDENESASRKASQLKHTHVGVTHETNQLHNTGMSHEKIKNHRKERTKMRFLQKFYHKGAFFQADADDRYGSAGSDPIYGRNYWIPTASENFDKTLLPVVMQVKNFGRRGRTKWTHLVAEDTSHRHLCT